MYISTIKALARLDKIKIVLADLSLLDRFFLLRCFAELKTLSICRRLLVRRTYRAEKLAKTIIELQMGVPKSMLHRFFHREVKFIQDDGLAFGAISS